MSSKGSNEVAGDITMCQKNLQFIEHNLDKQKTSVEKLKHETNKVFKKNYILFKVDIELCQSLYIVFTRL